MTVAPPSFFGSTKVTEFLRKADFIFGCEQQKMPDFVLDLSGVRKVSLIGQLLIYKFINYTASHQCFYKPSILWSTKENIEREFASSGMLEIINSHINNPKDARRILRSYRRLRVDTSSTFIFAPTRLLRREEGQRESLERGFLGQVMGFYADDKKVNVISTCLSELLSNFWSHATEETATVMVARGGVNDIEICFADNGQGIVNTLRGAKESFVKLPHDVVLARSLIKGVTSKEQTNHMGYGLYFVKKLSQMNNGTLSIYSNGAYVNVSSKKQEHGKCGNWKGTILQLHVDLRKPKTVKDIEDLTYYDEVRVNWS